MSKGSNPRPYSVDQKTFTDNWDAIFGKAQIKENIKWQELDQVTRQWAVLSGYEKDLANYARRKKDHDNL
jgi:hypothetical protein